MSKQVVLITGASSGLGNGPQKSCWQWIDAITPPEDYRELHEGFKKFMVNSYAGAPGLESTADAMVKAITVDKSQLVYKTTTDAKVGPTVLGMIPDRAFDSMVLRIIRGALDS
ncbi:hypothetical protein HC891_10910 [Candidatus Gracilibacteria bacterium]|nr:hypothetical protein [Candidatus Gracilibacteria bacterium]